MSGVNFRALTIQSGVTKQVQDTQGLIVGNFIDVGNAGALQIGATASGVTISPALTLSAGATVTTGGLTVSAGGATITGNSSVAGTFGVTTGLTTLGAGLTVVGTTTLSTLNSAGVVHTDGSGVLSTSKIAVGTDVTGGTTGQVLVSNGSTPTWTTFSQDATVNGTGVVTVVSANGAFSTGGALTVTTGGAAITGNSTVTGTFHVTSTSNLDGYVTAGAGINVIGGLTSAGTTTLSALGTGVLHANSSGVLSSSAVNLASADVTGVLPTANQAAQTMLGDVTGTTAASTVVKLQGNPVQATVLGSSQDGYVATWVNTDGYIEFKPAATVTAVTMGGDVTGLSSASTVVKINGTSVPATPSAAQVLIAQTGTSSLWETLSQDVIMTTGGVVTVNGSHAATFAATGAITAATTITAGTGLTVTSGGLLVSAGGANITGGTVTDTINTSGLATLNSASVTTTLGVTGVSTLTGGVATNAIDAITGVPLVIGGSTATTVQIGKSGALTEVLGNFKVDGTETILGASTFQNPVTFDGGNVTIVDGYSLLTDSISSTGIGSGVLTINGNAGLNLQYAGANALTFGSGTITVASPNIMSAASGAQIIATSSTGTTYTVLPNSVVATTLAAGTPTYITSVGAATATDSSALVSSYFVGISLGSGLGTITSGLATVTGPTVVGAPVYLGTAGTLTSTAPSSGVVAQVGLLVASGTMLIQVTSPVQL